MPIDQTRLNELNRRYSGSNSETFVVIRELISEVERLNAVIAVLGENDEPVPDKSKRKK